MSVDGCLCLPAMEVFAAGGFLACFTLIDNGGARAN